MPTINITYNPTTDQIYVSPPLARVTPTDRVVIWNLNGGNVKVWADPPLEFPPPAPGYSPWPNDAVTKVDQWTWMAVLSIPEGGNTQYYSWNYRVIDADGTNLIVGDPDIGNDPQGG